MAKPPVTNPLLASWAPPHGLPDYAAIRFAHFAPAFDAALQEHEREIETIATASAPATFENTILALERAGKTMERVAAVFYAYAGSDTTPEIQGLERSLAPRLTAHNMKIGQDARLFARIDDLDRRRATLGLSGEQAQVLDKYVRMFVRAGARLDAAGKVRLKAIAERTSSLATQFSQNVLKDEQSWHLFLNGEADLAGLDAGQCANATAAAEALGKPGGHAITLSRSSIVPFLETSTRRDLREVAYKAFIARGANGGATDNRAVLSEIARLRGETARLLGHATFADMSLEHTMAKTPASVTGLLDQVWQPARKAAATEKAALQEAARAEGGNFEIAGWDWRYYAEKVRKSRYALDGNELKAYFELNRMIDAAFDCATKLFGLRFEEQKGVALQNSEARLWRVTRTDGRLVGHFIGDFFARGSKRSGAWMSGLRGQHKLDGGETPIITNTCNFTKPAPGEPALLSLDDARTLFHEFGHALHGLLSNVTYPSVSGTRVVRDFVELPSQLYEHWLQTPQVLKTFATHWKTGEQISDDLIAKMKAAQNFNQGFASVEFLGSAYVDMALHTLSESELATLDIDKAEAKALSRIGMPAEISMRHRSSHFQHITGGYAAGYYSYLWSEVLDADAFSAFEETGDIFDKGIARRLHDHVYSAGGSVEAAETYIKFRGRLPDATALLAKRGFANAS